MDPSNLTIKAYSSSGFTELKGTYKLQINPGSVKCSYGKTEEKDKDIEPKSANGGANPLLILRNPYHLILLLT
jgi:hypothetical protein